MDPAKIEAIKKAIRQNFDASPENYDEFEDRTHLFTNLTVELAMESGMAASVAESALAERPRRGLKIADVGCGTGISTMILKNLAGPDGLVTGIDISHNMLELARKKASGMRAVRFIEGDAAGLDALLSEQQDAVLYNACIFLLPDAERSMQGAHALLKEGGVIGMNFIQGSYIGGRDLFSELFPEWTKEEYPAPKFPCDVASLESKLKETGFHDIRNGIAEKKMALEDLKRFYSVPAQSASLYPKMSSGDRRSAVERMFRIAEEKGFTDASMKWKWIVAKK
jgi:ubiquinone/menaquinone biosynthesis C-methylase UbiE